MQLLSNMIIGFCAFSIWYFSGLGLAFALLPGKQKKEALLLAPLIGMSLLTLIGLFQLTVLKIPIYPRANILFLIFSSFTICFYKRHLFFIAFKSFYTENRFLFIAPLIFLISFAWMFHNTGFHLLIGGGSDQLQYCENARQIFENMNTMTANDVPVPRQDHYVYEMCTRVLPYLKAYRRGAEVLLTTIKASSGLSFAASFPVMILNVLLTLGFALGFLGRFFQLSKIGCFVLQFIILTSFYLLEAHIQGSLALLTSLPLGFIALAGLARMVQTYSWRWLALNILIVAAYLSIYSEPAIINIIVPSTLLLGAQFYRSWHDGIKTSVYLGLMYLCVFIIAPFAIYSVAINAFNNLHAVASQSHTTNVAHHLISSQWNLFGVMMGSNSYYDLSSVNNVIAHIFSQSPVFAPIGFIIISCFGLAGFFKIKNSNEGHQAALLYACILFLWTSISLFLSLKEDSLRFFRSLQYALPFGLLGWVLLIYSFKKTQYILAKWSASIILISFILMNIFTCARTIYFITSHNTNNDPILVHFDDQSNPWQALKNELEKSARNNNPILISGFHDTIHPLAIAIMIHSQSHILGNSMRPYWPLYEVPINHHWSEFNTTLSHSYLNKIQQNESQPWFSLEKKLTDRADQAIVPVGASYPVEWKFSKDVFAPHVSHFENIADVIYRNNFEVLLKNNIISKLHQDTQGFYRYIYASGPILVPYQHKLPQDIILDYDGKIGDVTLKIHNKLYEGLASKNGHVKLTAKVEPQDFNNLQLILHKRVKLRLMTLNDNVVDKYEH